ncbi:amidohydrolase family protein [Streptomyces sp. NPDC020096]
MTETSHPTPSRTALTGVRVFDGNGLTEPRTVVIDGAVIGADPAGARIVDAAGAVLLPGLIDAHIHLHDRDTLRQLSAWGVTTGLDMASWPADLPASLRDAAGLTDIRSAGLPAVGPGGPHSKILPLPRDAVVTSTAQATAFVADRIAEGADYIKIVTEAPGEGGPAREVVDALVAAAHAQGRKAIAHASSSGAFTLAVGAGVDMVTHAPLDQPVTAADISRMAATGQVAIPTLTMMEGIAAGRRVPFDAAPQSVRAMHQAGVPILAGTDANANPSPFPVPHGESLHHELELLVGAGLSTVEVLRAATVLPAHHFGLTDRGAITSGLRADLVLIDGDPIADIRATRKIRRIWCAGVERTPATA